MGHSASIRTRSCFTSLASRSSSPPPNSLLLFPTERAGKAQDRNDLLRTVG